MPVARTLLTSNAPSLVLDVDHSSAASEARRVVAQIASTVGLSETMAGGAAIIVNELTTNILKHAKSGVLFVHGAGTHLDILAVDRGPGVRDIGLSMRDGYSSAGTAGNGLGAVRRLSSQFDIYSTPGRGTVVFSRLSAGAADESSRTTAVQVGAFWRPLNLDELCGDGCGVFDTGEAVICVVADGLGHGVSAAEASRAAVAVASEINTLEPVRIIERMQAALRPTRGAAVAVAVIHPRQETLHFAGVGNISATVRFDGKTKSLVSLNGTVGHEVRRVQEFRYEWRKESSLVMHSDGLTSRWSLDQEPGIDARHPTILAAVLARDFARERDDRCVVVVKEASP
jgi:anti-sigma regulatory factor (Ser/Thr protein kinase)